jgi:16S rRNA (adenine1518-N6/adenine1519-N6)-dimethyltransferase
MRARRRFGQHYLEEAWARRLVAAMRLDPGDAVVEIGPGHGALTFPLAAAVRQIAAIEVDRDLVAWLTPRVPANVRLVEGDVLDTPFDVLVPPGSPPGTARVVGNLPYNVSTPILFRILAMHLATGRLRDATVMLQREVADRLVARPGSKSYGILSIALQLDADISMLLTLPPGAFRPVPQVSSAVVRLSFRAPAVDVHDRGVFETLVRSIFSHRRKTIGNALKSLATARGTDSASALRIAGVDPARRPETLHLHELAAVARQLTAGQG